jgi:hypothetical protein
MPAPRWGFSCLPQHPLVEERLRLVRWWQASVWPQDLRTQLVLGQLGVGTLGSHA